MNEGQILIEISMLEKQLINENNIERRSRLIRDIDFYKRQLEDY